MKVEHNNQTQAHPRKLEWPSEVVLELIDLWITHKCLYDKSHRYYTNKNARFDALKDIADSLHYRMPDLSPNDVRIKINYLRGQYARELARQYQNSSKNGTDSDGCGAGDDAFSYEPTTYWFSKISFLRDFVKTKKRKFNYTSRSSKTISPFNDESDSDPLELLQPPLESKAKRPRTSKSSGSIKMENSEISNISNDIEIAVHKAMATPASTVVAAAPPPIITTSTSLTPTLQLPATIQTICGRQSIIQNTQSDVDAFANHIKLEMYKITDEELQDEIQHKIQNLLYEYKNKQRALSRQIQ